MTALTFLQRGGEACVLVHPKDDKHVLRVSRLNAMQQYRAMLQLEKSIYGENKEYLCTPVEMSYRNKCFFAMSPRLECDLFDVFYKKVEVTSEQGKDIILQVLLGVKCLQDAGYVHGDLKPENLLITPRANNGDKRGYHCKITDFGFLVEAGKQVNLSKAKYPRNMKYVAPEIRDQSCEYVTTEIDIWGCGIVYYLLYYYTDENDQFSWVYNYIDESLARDIRDKIGNEDDANFNALKLIRAMTDPVAKNRINVDGVLRSFKNYA